MQPAISNVTTETGTNIATVLPFPSEIDIFKTLPISAHTRR